MKNFVFMCLYLLMSLLFADKTVFVDMYELENGLTVMLNSDENPEDIVEREGMKQVSDTGELESIIDNIIQNNPDQVIAVKEKPKLMGWFVGQVMKETNGKANPKLVNELLNSKLNV